MLLPQKVKIYIEGLCVLCVNWWKRKVIFGMFKWIEEKYGGFGRTQEGETLGGGWTNGRRREYRRVGKMENKTSYK